jgi:IPT/TIG domain
MGRRAITSCGLTTLVMLAGCGGGSNMTSVGVGGGGTSSQSNAPVVTAISPSSVVAGAAAAVSMSVYGSGFQAGAAVEWNGTTLTTTAVNATQLMATVPVANLASVGTAKVTVANPSPPAGTSNSESFNVIAALPATNRVTSVGVNPKDVAWDAVHGQLYVSIPSTDPTSPNTVVAVNPTTGKAGTPVPVGNNPELLSLSADDSYLWVGLNGDHAVQRLLLPSLTKDISFPLPNDTSGNPQQPVSLEAARVNVHTVAVVAGAAGFWGGDGNGVYVYDDATPRPASIAGPVAQGPILDWVQWGSNDNTLYGTQGQTDDQAGIATMQVTSAGVTLPGPYLGALTPTVSQYDAQNGLLYSYGGAYDPVNMTQVGQFDFNSSTVACTADSSVSRYYCALNVFNPYADTQFELWVFDLNSYALLGRVYLEGAISGRIERLVRWGSAGLALATASDSTYGTGGLFLIDGAAVNPNAAPDITTGSSVNSYIGMKALSPQGTSAGSPDVTITVTGTNFTQDTVVQWTSSANSGALPTSYVSPTQITATIPAANLQSAQSAAVGVFDSTLGNSSLVLNGLTFTVYPASGAATTMTALNLSPLDVAWDGANGVLYVGTNDSDPAYPNSILAINPATGAVQRSVPVSADPDLLSVSAGGQYLYVGFLGATSLTQLTLPGLTSPLSWTLNDAGISGTSAGPYFAGDVKAAPTSPHTTAVSFVDVLFEPVQVMGVAIYDNATQRPQIAPGVGVSTVYPPPDYDTLAWGNTDSILAGAQNDVDGLQPLYSVGVSASGASYLASYPSFNGPDDNIHEDFGTGMIYSDDGKVANPVTGAITGSYGASGIVTPDSTLNRVFILGQTAAQAQTTSYTIESFSETGFTPISSVTIENIAGTPIVLTRWGASGLVVATSDAGGGVGMLYLLANSTFVSGAPGSYVTPVVAERVQRRWKGLSKTTLAKALRAKMVEKAQHE